MRKNKKIEETKRIKDLFKKVSKLTLPAIAIIGVSMSTMSPSFANDGASKKNKATVISPKEKTTHGLMKIKISCDSGCSGGCEGGCSGSCSGSCDSGCSSGCSGGCSGCSSCSGGCTMT